MQYACKLRTNLSMNNKHCHDMQKMQHRIGIFKMQNIQYLPKKCSWSAKKTFSIKHDRILEKMQHRLCIMPFLEVTILFNQHLHYRGEYRGKIPDGHSNPICLLLKPLKLQNSWRIFDRPVSSMYCKYAEYASKLQTNLFMRGKQCHDMQKNAISYFEYVEYAGICKNHSHVQQKKDQ